MGSESPHYLQPRPFGGDYLQIAIELDAGFPGHLQAAFRGSDLIRQTKFLIYAGIMAGRAKDLADQFAAVSPPSADEQADTDRAVIGRALATLRPREIVEAAFGEVANGLFGLLARLGSEPLLDPTLYLTAISLFADPQHRRRAALLRQIEGKVSPAKIVAAARLPEVLLRPAVVSKIHDAPMQLAGLATVVDYIRVVCNADDEAIAHSLNDLKPGSSGQDLKVWAKAWMARQVRLHVPPPIPAEDPAFALILGKELTRLGREYRICLGERLAESFLGSSIHYLWKGAPSGPAVIALSPLTGGGWFVEEARRPRNRRLSRTAMRVLAVALGKYGIAIHLATPEGTPSPGSLRYIIDSWASGLGFDDEAEDADEDGHIDLDEDEPDLEVRRHLRRFVAGLEGRGVLNSNHGEESETA